jgi:ABC-type Na+ efflux pump permease subunit
MATIHQGLRDYRRLEARHAVGRAPLVGFAAGVVLLAISQIVTPLLPAQAISVLEQAFHIRGMGAVILLNDHLAVYTVLYFVGISQLLQGLVAPREERQLDLLLAKPVPPEVFLAARVLPILASVAVLGGALSVGCALAVAPYTGPGEDVTVLGTFAAGLFLSVLTAAMLAGLCPVLVGIHDSFQGLLLSLVAWVLPLLPASAFVYRPDVFEGPKAAATALVSPANLIWYDAWMPVAAAVAGFLAAGVVVVSVRIAGGRLGRLDSR